MKSISRAEIMDAVAEAIRYVEAEGDDGVRRPEHNLLCALYHRHMEANKMYKSLIQEDERHQREVSHLLKRIEELEAKDGD